jgi:hypothetical protein
LVFKGIVDLKKGVFCFFLKAFAVGKLFFLSPKKSIQKKAVIAIVVTEGSLLVSMLVFDMVKKKPAI